MYFFSKNKIQKNNKPLFYCNRFDCKRPLEKIRDFRKCSKIVYRFKN